MFKKIMVSILALSAGLLTIKGQAEPAFLTASEQDVAKRTAWVDSVYKSLTLEERIGQMFIYTFAPQTDKRNIDHIKRVIQDYKIGGILFSGGEVANQVKLTNLAQEETNVPLMITFDGEWGLSMRLKNTPKYPRNMVLGCITDEALLYAYGKEMGRQCNEMGVHVNFAPVADVNINPNNPVINTRSYGENPQNVSDKVLAYSKGLEMQNVLSVAKHFPGHGDTNIDSHKSLPVLSFDRARLDSVELYPFTQLTKARLGGVMVGHLHIPALDPVDNIPSSLSKPIVTDLLKDSIGFKGLVFTDALEMRGVAAHKDVTLKAILAGNDMILVPRNMKKEMSAILAAVKNGTLSEEVIEGHCKKILMYKYEMNLTATPKIQLSGLMQRINTKEATSLIDRLEEAAITLIKNQDDFLPLTDTFKKLAVVYTGTEASYNELFKGLGETFEVGKFQLASNLSVAYRNSLEKQLAGYDRVLVCIDQGNFERYETFFNGLTLESPMGYVIFMSGDKLAKFEKAIVKADMSLLAHSKSTVVQDRVVDILLGREKANGKLSVSVGEAFPAGTNWLDQLTELKRKNILAKELGLDLVFLSKIDTIALEAIAAKAFPGCQVTVLKGGHAIYNKAFGTFTGKGSKVVTVDDLYDIASVSKTTGTLLGVMKLYDQGLLNLTDYASAYLPELKGTDKANLTIESLLYHESGMGAGLSVYNEIIDPKSYKGPLFRAYKDARHTIEIGRRTWANPNYKFKEGLTSKVANNAHTMHVANDLWFVDSVRDSVWNTIIDTKLLTKRYRYSCLGFIILQKVVEKIANEPLDSFLAKHFFSPMGLTNICYTPLKYVDKDRIVPSTNDKFFRKQILQGYVHDELAALQGGVSGNAGQFSTALDIATIYQMILDEGFYKGKRILSESTCRIFTTKKSKISRRGLGFDKPNPNKNEGSACLQTVPKEVFGHTGFTGSCVWADPVNNLVFVLNCNRTYPSAWPNKLAKEDVRNRMQQALYDAL